MKTISQVAVLTALIAAAPAWAEADKDCLMKGKVVRGEQAGQETTTVKIHSVSRYNDESRCKVRRDQKMEFKLPADSRVQEAPSGSKVKYRYRTDESGKDNAELISVGA